MLITTPSESFVIRFPKAIEYTEKQLSVFWLPNEIRVEKDVHDILTNLTEAEKHGVLTVLKLFSLYELFAGRDYWTGKIMSYFPRPEIQRMASTFGMFELAVHQPFYDKINQELGISTDEFYNSYVQDEDLANRIAYLNKQAESDNLAVSLATFSMLEGAVLYSSFAFLKHFQSQGKNKLLNIVRGINFSVRDENIHAEAGAWLFRELHPEGIPLETQSAIYENALVLREHEHAIVKKIFEKGKIIGITDNQLFNFVDSRLNLCLQNLGLKAIFEDAYNPISDWFYDGINNYIMNDFFTGQGNQYSRDWKQEGFKW